MFSQNFTHLHFLIKVTSHLLEDNIPNNNPCNTLEYVKPKFRVEQKQPYTFNNKEWWQEIVD